MLVSFVRRLALLIGLGVAAYVAFAIPIGRRTAWQHVVAIFSTEPAHEAAADLKHLALAPLRALAARESLSEAASEPSQHGPPRGKTPAPGITHVRSANQGVPASP